MRIALVSINYFPEVTGIAPYSTRLAEGLTARGHHVTVFTGLPHYPEWHVHDAYRHRHSHIEVINGVIVDRSEHFIPERALNVFSRIRLEMSFSKAISHARLRDYELVISVSPSLMSTAVVAIKARLWRRPLGVIVHDLYGKGVAELGTLSGRLAAMVSRAEARVLGSASGIAVIHDRFVDILGDMGVDRGSISVLRNWTHVDAVENFDETRRRQVRHDRGWQEDELVVVHAGNMGRKQGLSTVVDAARLAAGPDARRAVRFVLLGDGNQRELLQRRAAGVPGIDFIAPLPEDEFRELLAAADVLLLNEKPGVGDMAVPSKLTTYFNAGRPVLAAAETDSCAAQEVRAAKAGTVIAPGDPRLLLDAAIALGADQVAARGFGQSARRYSHDVLSEDAALAGYEQWCRDVACHRSGAEDMAPYAVRTAARDEIGSDRSFFGTWGTA